MFPGWNRGCIEARKSVSLTGRSPAELYRPVSIPLPRGAYATRLMSRSMHAGRMSRSISRLKIEYSV